MRKKFLRISVIFTVLLLIPIVFSYKALMSGHKKHFLFFPAIPLQSSSLVLVGPDQDPNPVLNEGRQIQLRLLTSNGQSVTGATFTSDSPDIANVDAQTGMVSGLQRGYATITARMGSQSVSTFVIVTRINNSSAVKVPGDTKVDTQGAIYLSDPIANVVYKKNNADAPAQVFAGRMGSRGRTDGERTQALFAGPTAIAVDNRPEGGTYVADTLNHSIRKIGFNDQVVTVLGNGSQGINNNDVTPFEQAAFNAPQGIAIDAGGNVYIVDTGNNAIYVANFDKKEVRLLAGQPGMTGKADGQGREALFSRPTAISVQASNTSFFGSQQPVLLVADTGNGRIRSVSLDGKVRTVGPISQTATQDIEPLVDNEFEFNEPTSISVDGVGNIYVVDKSGAKLITDNPNQRQMISLAQPGVSFGQAASVVVQGTQTFVLDSNARNDSEAVKVITIGAPQIINMTQDSDRLGGGTEIIVTGKNFAPESDVILGDKVVNATIESSTRLRFTVPSQDAPGIRTLSIRTRGGVIQRPFRVFSDPFDGLPNGNITTFAGGIPFLGDGGNALEASLNRPEGVVIDGMGNTLVIDSSNHRIRSIDSAGVITTIAGNGVRGFSGDGGLALAASLNLPKSIAVDSSGNIFIADFGNSRIRRVDAITGVITTVAGNGTNTFGGDNGLATAASLRFPQGIAIDSAGNILIADTGNNRVRRVDAQTGMISTIAGTGSGNVTGDGGLASSAAIGAIEVIAIDSTNNIFILGSANNRIRRIDATSKNINTVVGTGTKGFSGDGGPAINAQINSAEDFTIDIFGNIFIADSANSRIRKVDAKTGVITTVAGSGLFAFGGDGGQATNATLNVPKAVAVNGLGVLFIADTGNNRVRQVSSTGVISTIAGNGTSSFTPRGVIADTRFDYPEAMTIDSNGIIYVADTFNNRVVLLDINRGVADTLAGDDDIDPNEEDDDFGNEFDEDDGDNDDDDSGDDDDDDDDDDDGGGGGDDDDDDDDGGGDDDGGDDDGSMDDEVRALIDAALNVKLKFPRGIALDEDTLYVADTSNNVIRQVDLATGNSTIIAGTGMAGFSGDDADATKARLNSPHGLVIDNDGNLLIADSDNRRIRKLDFLTGIITTIAGTGMAGSAGDGGQARMAQLTFPRALAIDSAGNLFLVDNDANRVRKIDRNGVITTVAGNGQAGFSGDGGQAAMASLNLPKSIVVDDSGNLFIADTENDRIRRVDVQTGIITTIAGTGVTGFSGDGGNATQAKLSSPHGLALDDDGNLFVLDTFNNAIRAMKVSRSGANAADFSLTVSPASQNIQVGSSASFRIGFNALNNFNGSIALNTSVTPANSGISLNLSSNNITVGQSATLMVNVASAATTGTFNIIVSGQSGTITRQEMIRLVVTPKPAGDFVLAVRPTVQSVSLGAATSFTVNTQAINEFTDAISLNVNVEPVNSGLSLAFSNNNIAAGASSTLTVNASSTAALGDFNVTINATSGQVVRSQVVKLSVVQMLRPPKITPITDQMVKSGDVVNLAVTTMDADPAGLALSIVSAPGYVSLTDNGNGNGMIRIAPPMNAQSGTVTLRAINGGGLTDQISFQVIVAGGVTITNATFAKPVLTISGMGFQTSGAIVRVNNVDVSRNIRSQTDSKIELKGNKKKLSLQKGQNTVVVIINGITSNSVIFNF